ncbi:MAG: hypothetical protein P4L22_05160 [Candidatus Babeliales bacterium]|nr:hypothetical protein [Candidatus Babeliales bacterium]
MKKIILFSLFLIFNSYSSEQVYIANINQLKYKNQLSIIFIKTIKKLFLITGPNSELEKTWNSLIKLCINNPKFISKKNEDLFCHKLVKLLIKSANYAKRINKKPNFLFITLFETIQETIDEKDSLANIITTHNDLESILRGVLFLTNKYKFYEKDTDNIDPEYQDNLIQECIEESSKCTPITKFKPGPIFIDLIIDQIPRLIEYKSLTFFCDKLSSL